MRPRWAKRQIKTFRMLVLATSIACSLALQAQEVGYRDLVLTRPTNAAVSGKLGNLTLQGLGIIGSLPPGTRIRIPNENYGRVKEDRESESKGRRFKALTYNPQTNTSAFLGPYVGGIEILSWPSTPGFTLEEGRRISIPLEALPGEEEDSAAEENQHSQTAEPTIAATDELWGENSERVGNAPTSSEELFAELEGASPTETSNANPVIIPPVCECTTCEITDGHGTQTESSCDQLQESSVGCSQAQREVFVDGNEWNTPIHQPILAPCDGDVIEHGRTENEGVRLVLLCEINGKHYQFAFNRLKLLDSKLRSDTKMRAGEPMGITGLDFVTHQIHEMRPGREREIPQIASDSIENGTTLPAVIQAIDPSAFYANKPSLDVLAPISGSENPPLRSEELSAHNEKLFNGICPVLEREEEQIEAEDTQSQEAIN